MRMFPSSFPIWWLMHGVAIAACGLGAVVGFSNLPNTAGSVITGWACCYGIPILLIVTRKLPLGNVARAGGWGVLVVLPFACLFGLACFLMSGYAGLIGGFSLIMLMTGWATLMAAGVSPIHPDRPASIDHPLYETHERGGERH